MKLQLTVVLPPSPRTTLLISGLLFLGLAAALPWLLRRTD